MDKPARGDGKQIIFAIRKWLLHVGLLWKIHSFILLGILTLQDGHLRRKISSSLQLHISNHFNNDGSLRLWVIDLNNKLLFTLIMEFTEGAHCWFGLEHIFLVQFLKWYSEWFSRVAMKSYLLNRYLMSYCPHFFLTTETRNGSGRHLYYVCSAKPGYSSGKGQRRNVYRKVVWCK